MMGKRNRKNRIWAGVLVLVMVLTTFAPVQKAAAEEGTAEEPGATNITFDTARDLNFNTSIAEELSYNDTKRYYKFSVSEASVLNLGIDKKSDATIDVYDEARTSVFNKRIHYTYESSMDIYLTGGNYYLGIETSASYTMLASIDSLSESFIETQDVNNNGSNTASAIAFGINYKGVMAQNDDKDYYKFTLPEASNVNISLTNSTKHTLKYTFYDGFVNKSYTNTVRSGQKADQTITLAPDTYYLAITKEDDSANGSYNFLLSSVKIVETPKPTPKPNAGTSNTGKSNATTSNTKTSNTTASKAKVKTPKAPTNLSLKNTSSRKLTVRWKAVSGVSGYQLLYSTKKNLNGSISRLFSSSITNIKIFNLTKKKTYYVKIRSYTTSHGVPTYSKWSKVKKVKIRK